MSEIDQKQAHLLETTEAQLHDTTKMLRLADVKLAEARTRQDIADIQFATAHDLLTKSRQNLDRTVRLRRRLSKLDLLVILLVILLATHVI